MTDKPAIAAAPREAAPIPLWAMAVFALTPFPLAAGVYAYGPADASREAVTMLLTWSAVVLSFLAGVRWGLESGRGAPRAGRLVVAVGFAVAAWALLILRWRLPLAAVVGVYIAAFMAQWLTDHAAPDSAARFPRLSTAVTAAACISLAVALDKAIRG